MRLFLLKLVMICGERFFFSAFTIFVAITIPFFGDLVGFLGGIAFAPTTFLVNF